MTSPIDSNLIVYQTRIIGARSWSFIIRRGFTLRITDIKGGANCSLFAYNNDDKLERYNMADTLKAQHTAKLTKGHVLYSDMGRILFSISEDSCGWHDTIGGINNAAIVKEKYGVKPYQGNCNAFYRNGRELFLIEASKHGLGKKDLIANINLFSKIAVDNKGNLQFVENNSQAGDVVDLRAEMDTLVVLNTCQHPLDPNTEWSPKPVDITLWKSGDVSEDDICRNHCPENQRGFINTQHYFCQY